MLLEYATTTAPPHTMLVAEIVSSLEPLADEWRALCAEGACDQPFFRPEWFAAYLRAFAGNKKLLALTARRNGRLRAVLPLIAERVTLHGLPVRKLRSAANVHSCRFDLIHGASDRAEAVQAIWNLLKRMSGWDVIELEDVPAGGAGESLLRVAEVDGYRVGQWARPPGSYLTLPQWDALGEKVELPISGKFRKSLRSYRRRLESRGALQLRVYEQHDPASLESFYHLEKSGWKGQAGTAIACDEQTKRFYSEAARAAAKYGYFTLYSLEQQGQPIAMQYCLTYGRRCHLLKPAYDEGFSEFSPGQLLTYEILRDLIAQGFQEYDLMSPQSEWKLRWAKSLREQSSCYIFRRDWLGSLLHAWKFRFIQTARNWQQNNVSQ